MYPRSFKEDNCLALNLKGKKFCNKNQVMAEMNEREVWRLNSPLDFGILRVILIVLNFKQNCLLQIDLQYLKL